MIKQCVVCDVCGGLQLVPGPVSYKFQESAINIRITENDEYIQLDLCRRCYKNLIDFLNKCALANKEHEKVDI